jgi:hypothetical protein
MPASIAGVTRQGLVNPRKVVVHYGTTPASRQFSNLFAERILKRVKRREFIRTRLAVADNTVLTLGARHTKASQQAKDSAFRDASQANSGPNRAFDQRRNHSYFLRRADLR